LLVALAACDSSTAFIVASILCAATAVLAGGVLFIGRARSAETIPGLLESLAALLIALPIAAASWVLMLLVAVAHCGLD
jgi:hypothetical protein